LLGYDVEVVNTVNYSNHSGYGRTGGWKSNPQELVSIFDVMEKNGLLNASRILSGYVPDSEALLIIQNVIRRLRQRQHEIIYLLDPVIGDAGKLYVSSDVIPIYRNMLSLATIITPNYFEAELLTNVQINSLESLRTVLRTFHHEYKIPHVVISSIPLSGTFLKSLPDWLYPQKEDNSMEPLLCICSSMGVDSSREPSLVHALHIPRIPGYFSGVGDLFSALVLAHFQRTSSALSVGQTPLSYAVFRACQTTHAILWRTHLYSMSLPPEDRAPSDEELDDKDPERKVRRMKGRELRLIQEQYLIVAGDADVGYTEGYTLHQIKEWTSFWDID